ncbi:MAG: alpha/beta fold hydrolase [Actinobacteria bacterium]|nr:alpha/beta fold hydrolase [Actinomycetota bacterium]
MAVESRMIDIGGVATHVTHAGDGVAVLLLHGSGPGVSAAANWRLAIPALSERFRVIAPDQLGFGLTGPPADGVYSMQAWVAHVVAVLDELGIERAHVVGNSFGGAVALHLAVHHPERVNRLALMGAVGLSFPISDGLDAVWGYEPSVAEMRRLLEIFTYEPSPQIDELAVLRYEASIVPGVQEQFSAMFPAPRQRWVDAMALPEDRVAAIEHETLILHGREDRVIPLDVSLRLHHLIPRSQLHVFGQCGHWTQVEHPDRFHRLVGDFFAE